MFHHFSMSLQFIYVDFFGGRGAIIDLTISYMYNI